MIWLLLILFVPGGGTRWYQERDPSRSYIEVRPCDSNDIVATMWLPIPGENPKYTLTLPLLRTLSLRSGTNLLLKFDSPLILPHCDKTEIVSSRGNNIVYIKESIFYNFFDHLTCDITIPMNSLTLPYVQSIVLDEKKQLCENPKNHYFDHLVIHSEVTSPSLGQICGRQKVLHTGLIVHGQASKAAHWPWHVALYRIEKQSLRYICGGTLLSKTMVVTAGHCASIRRGAIIPELLRVHLGKHHLFERDIGQQEREVFKVILHPGFNGVTLDNDIALLKLKSEVMFTDYVQPACLWYEQAINMLPPMFIFGTVAGWGFDNKDSLSNILQQITIPLVPELTCVRSSPIFYRLLKSTMFCAGFRNGTAVCNGDSGGGLMIFVPETPGGSTAGAWHVRGIVSVAPSIKERNVCDPDQYTIFTDVEKYRDWVLGYLD